MPLYPKFNCELDYIEFFWGAVKRENWNYILVAGLEPTVLAGLESVSLRTIQRFANRSRQVIDSCINGLNDKQRELLSGRKSLIEVVWESGWWVLLSLCK